MVQMKGQDEGDKVVPVDEQVDVTERGRRLQKFGGSVAIPCPAASVGADNHKGQGKYECSGL